MDSWSEFLALLWRHRGKVAGACIGLVVGLLFLFFGFFKTLILLFFLGVGYQFGSLLDRGEDLEEWWRHWRGKE